MNVITYTVFADRLAQRASLLSCEWEDLVQRIRNPGEYPSKDACPLLKLATFGEERTEKNSLRHDANLRCVSGIEGDYDGELVSIQEAARLLAAAGVETVLYTSARHTDQRQAQHSLLTGRQCRECLGCANRKSVVCGRGSSVPRRWILRPSV